MASRRIYRIGAYVPSALGHFAAKLEPEPDDPPFSAEQASGTTLWSPVQDEGKEGLQRMLLHPANADLLALLAGRPEAKVDLRLREVGHAGDVDVVAMLRDPHSGDRILLLVDCEAAGLTKPSRLRAQYVRALRNSRSFLSNASFSGPTPDPVVVLLASWRPFMELPKVEHRPGWQGDAVPAPHWWGYVPFRVGDEEYVVFGRWYALDGDRRVRAVQQRASDWFDRELKVLLPPSLPMRRIDFRIDLGKGSGLSFYLDRGPFRARLRVAAPKHRRALLPEDKEDFHVRRIRSLRNAAYATNWAPTGWEFLGETIDEGCPGLVWRWQESKNQPRIGWGVASDEAERFAITMKMYIAGI